MNNVLIKNYPHKERPRERMKQVGVKHLSNTELLAIILRTGTKNESALMLASKILKRIEHIQDLKDLTINELKDIKGVGEVKAIEVLAALELGERVVRTKENKHTIIKSSCDAYNYAGKDIENTNQEILLCIYLNNMRKVMKVEKIFKGTMDHSLIHPREIFLNAYKNKANFIILIHNHPSGNIEPSDNDLRNTEKLIEIGLMMGVKVIDHLIVSNGKYTSMRDNGYIEIITELF